MVKKTENSVTITRAPKMLAQGVIWGEFMVAGELREISATWRDNFGPDADDNPGGILGALVALEIVEAPRFRVYYNTKGHKVRVIQWLHTINTVNGGVKDLREVTMVDFFTAFVLPNWPEIVQYFVDKNHSDIMPVAPTIEEFNRYYKHENWK